MDMMIDPPSGWMFGFPKRISEEERNKEGFSMTDWLIENGYPRNLIDELGDMFYVRMWTVQ